MDVKSEIKAVTVYNDRALIERYAKLNLASGEHKLIFIGLPVFIDTNSIQVSGGENCMLLEIKSKDVHLDEISDTDKKEIHHELENLEIQIEEVKDIAEGLNHEKSLLQKLAELSSESPKKGIFHTLIPEKINEAFSFYAEKLASLNASIRANNRKLEKLNEQKHHLQEKAKLYHNSGIKKEKHVEIKLFAQEELEQIIVLSYIVTSAGWKPIYDFRLNSNEKKLNVTYSAIVQQKTGEKWDNVKISLSTARPQISATQPNIKPWMLDVYQAPTPSPKLKKMEAPMSMASLNDKFFEMEEGKADKPMQIPNSKVESGISSVNFEIQGTHTIPDTNEEHKIGISVLNFDASLEYYAVPKLSPFAYLTATSTNDSNFPILPGIVNVFLDNRFVANSAIKLVAPNQEFKTSLGIDESIHIEHKLINKFTKDEGIFSKKSKIIFDYNFEILNNKKIDCTINIKDQIPVSKNQEINVELLDPKYKEDTPELTKSKDGIIEWKQNIKSGEKLVFGLKFTVEFPRDIEIYGL